MTYAEIIFLAYALSVDACVVSFLYGMQRIKSPAKSCMLLALFTGFFQFIMPILGYYITSLAYTYLYTYAKWIVFGIFVYLGIKFIKEAFDRKNCRKILCLDAACLIMTGFATSVDALAAGISLKLSGNLLIKPAILIGVVTFINSMLGFNIGRRFRRIPATLLEIFAGLILIMLGIKSLI